MQELKTHISEEEIKKFHTHELSLEEFRQVLEHTSDCTFCAKRLADSIEAARPYRAPANFKEAVLQRVNAGSKEPQLSFAARKKQYLFYSTKVCAAAALALLFLFSLPAQEPTAASREQLLKPALTEQLNTVLNSTASSLNEKINYFFLNQPLKEELHYD